MAASEPPAEGPWACVLAGGASRRFGVDKAHADAPGRPGVPRTVAVARLLAPRSAGRSPAPGATPLAGCSPDRAPSREHPASGVAPETACRAFAVAREAGAFDAWGLPAVTDLPDHAGAGPLAGLLAGLRHREQEAGPGWLLVAACDVVDLDPDWPALLPEPEHADASVFREPGRFFQPLPGRYHTRLTPALEAALTRGDRSFQRLLPRVRTHTVPPPPGLATAAASGNKR